MKCLLKCEITPGQFSDEFAVVSTTHNGMTFSLFAPSDHVINANGAPTNEAPVNAWLTVDCIEKQDAVTLVRLPYETFESGQTVLVASSHVKQL